MLFVDLGATGSGLELPFAFDVAPAAGRRAIGWRGRGVVGVPFLEFAPPEAVERVGIGLFVVFVCG